MCKCNVLPYCTMVPSNLIIASDVACAWNILCSPSPLVWSYYFFFNSVHFPVNGSVIHMPSDQNIYIVFPLFRDLGNKGSLVEEIARK